MQVLVPRSQTSHLPQSGTHPALQSGPWIQPVEVSSAAFALFKIFIHVAVGMLPERVTLNRSPVVPHEPTQSGGSEVISNLSPKCPVDPSRLHDPVEAPPLVPTIALQH